MKIEDKIAAFTGLTDLLNESLGAKALSTSDDFFAGCENLTNPDPAIFDADRFTDRGKWMDGWESRRRRVPGHDWCVLKLAQTGYLRGFDIDTSHFLGNHPPFASIEACLCDSDEKLNDAEWQEILPQSALRAGSHNYFSSTADGPWSHVRLNIFPDGGVARLRAYGEVVVAPDRPAESEPFDLAALANGGRALACSDMFFGKAEHLIHPHPAENMGGGWESRRRRDDGHDWAIVKLATRGMIEGLEIDTNHFMGNFPDSCVLEGIDWPTATAFALTQSDQWTAIGEELGLQQDTKHEVKLEQAAGPYTHVRLRIFPCGGVSRLRVWGKAAQDSTAPLDDLTSHLNQLSESECMAALNKCCGSSAWAKIMTASRPFADRLSLNAAADHHWWSLTRKDWLEAFSHHPEIGADKEKLRAKFARTKDWSEGEQAGVDAASEETLEALAAGNVEYKNKFGYVFLICATGKSAAEMLACLNSRFANDAENELRKAAAEQTKITQIRLNKLGEEL